MNNTLLEVTLSNIDLNKVKETAYQNHVWIKGRLKHLLPKVTFVEDGITDESADKLFEDSLEDIEELRKEWYCLRQIIGQDTAMTLFTPNEVTLLDYLL